MSVIASPQILLIAGTGRNSGKTALACRVIATFCNDYQIIAIKVSRHIFHAAGLSPVNYNGYDFFIAEETDTGSDKDSARMLRAGAMKSYFVVAADEMVTGAMAYIFSLNGPEFLYVAESGGLRNSMVPTLFIRVRNPDQVNTKTEVWDKNDYIEMTFQNGKFEPDAAIIEIHQNQWKISQKK